jgi:3-oxoacyl-[acyl-carrier protein] reductase
MTFTALVATHSTGSYMENECALAGFNANLAIDFGAFGIIANSIAPGTVRMGMTRDLLNDLVVADHFTSRVPAGRVGEVKDIASAIALLADEDAGFCKGTKTRLDGGYALGSYTSSWSQ